MSKRLLLVLAVAALYVLHQDVWFWRQARPLVFGFMPIGLFYHACFSVAASLLMWLLVTHAWPAHLEREVEHEEERPGGPGGREGVAAPPRFDGEPTDSPRRRP
jgi:hypothetical protein